jgi:hypothetical protein
MDPYLEGSLWTTVHFSLAAEIIRQLAPRLQPRYLVLPAERFVMESPESVAVVTPSIYPDVGIAQAVKVAPKGNGGAVATAPLRLTTIIPTPVPHVTIEIRDTAKRQLVTAIELLSPTNKRGDGRHEYLTKRRQILLSSAHLMEIDLLREGHRVPMQEALPAAPYFVFLSRAENRPVTEVWPIAFDQPLPTVPIPLLPGDADVLLDLQATFTAVYDLLGYNLAVDYHQPPELPLKGPAAQWADEMLRSAGLRQ